MHVFLASALRGLPSWCGASMPLLALLLESCAHTGLARGPRALLFVLLRLRARLPCFSLSSSAWPRALAQLFLAERFLFVPSAFACLLGPMRYFFQPVRVPLPACLAPCIGILAPLGSSPSALARLLGTVLWYLGAAAALSSPAESSEGLSHKGLSYKSLSYKCLSLALCHFLVLRFCLLVAHRFFVFSRPTLWPHEYMGVVAAALLHLLSNSRPNR